VKELEEAIHRLVQKAHIIEDQNSGEDARIARMVRFRLNDLANMMEYHRRRVTK
jgi:hypothetical protein